MHGTNSMWTDNYQNWKRKKKGHIDLTIHMKTLKIT